MRNPHGWRMLGAALTLLAAGACSSKPEPPKGKTYVYHMRGVITAVRGADSPEGPLEIHHEAVPDFVDASGQASPMAAMTMPFEVAPGVSISQLKAGDKVAFTLEMNWDAAIHHITAITELPPDTKLTFGRATTMPAATRH